MKLRISKADLGLLLAPLLCFGFMWLNSRLDVAQRLEWRSLDWRTQVRAGMQQPAPDERLLVIGIGEDTTINISPWPFQRSYHGEFQVLARYDPPRVWAWDIIFEHKRKADGTPLDPEDDAGFTEGTRLLREAGVPVVFAAVSSDKQRESEMDDLGLTQPLTNVVGDISGLEGDRSATLPYPGIKEQGYFGFADAPRGAGGIVRWLPLLIRTGEQVLPSLSLQVVMQYWGIEADEVAVVMGEAIDLGPKAEHRLIPIDDRGRMLLNYRYEKIERGEELGFDFPVVEYFDHILSLDQYFRQENREYHPPVPMADRIVLVGEFATDTGATPFSDQSPLVLLQANAINNVLNGDHIQVVSELSIWLGALLVSYPGLGLFRQRSIILLVLFSLLVMVSFVGWTFFSWIDHNRWVPLVAPLGGFVMLQFCFIIYRVVLEQKAKIQMRQMFGSYLSPAVIAEMVNSGEQPELGGIESEVTAYFSDIQGFSSFSEVLSPTQLVALLNEYLTACTDIIREQGGTLDKYIGDAVVAMFGAPVQLDAHAYRACLTSLLVQKKIGELRAGWEAAGDQWPDMVKAMRTRIGLNTGRCLIGNMGSRTRFDYTMMGDDVNLGARMESGAKFWGVYNMVTEATRRACEEHGGGRIVFRALGRIQVRGRAQPVPIYEVVGLAEEVTEKMKRCRTAFEAGLEHYYARSWSEAKSAFEASLPLEWNQPGRDVGVRSNPSLVYLKILDAYAQRPPGEDWNGVYTMEQK